MITSTKGEAQMKTLEFDFKKRDYAQKSVIENEAKLAGYVGSLLMVIFAFTMIPQIAIAGLFLLTIQSIDAKMHNLTVLNAISIAGFFSQLF
jgi:4-hydroxybenzoate polyprenyltransferase